MSGLLDDLFNWLRPFGARSALTSEPRLYRLGPRGRAALYEAMAAGLVDTLSVDTLSAASALGRPARGRATAMVVHGFALDRTVAASVSVSITPADAADLAAVATELVQFIARWFAPTRAASAFVSDNVEDYPNLTAHENAQGVGVLIAWPALQRHARGVFWGNGLGPGLCTRLGGLDRVIHEAPANIVRPMGDGAWLQASDAPPAGADAMQRMATYMQPLLNWSAADLVANRARSSTAPPVISSGSMSASTVATSRRVTRRRLVVDVRRGDLSPTQSAINIYVVPPLTAEAAAQLTEVVTAWYREGFIGTYGGAGFHHLRGPSIDETRSVVRWHVDFGSADEQQAREALHVRLQALEAPNVLRIRWGVEEVGGK